MCLSCSRFQKALCARGVLKFLHFFPLITCTLYLKHSHSFETRRYQKNHRADSAFICVRFKTQSYIYFIFALLYDCVLSLHTTRDNVGPGLSRDMRKPFFFCICENKDADQLRSHCAANQRLCFRLTESANPSLPKSEISSL